MAIFFTHIPKTAGTSIRKAVFENNIPKEKRLRYSGIKDAIWHNGASFYLLLGHYPYGIHKLYNSRPLYFTILREPVERAISQYYFIKRTSENSSEYISPNYDLAKSNSLTIFNSIPKFQNLQTRFLAGISAEFIGRHFNMNGKMGKLVLNRAKHNLLKNYQAFGLKERFKESCELFASRLNWTYKLEERNYKKTHRRPAVEDLNKETVQQLRSYNSLDMELYDFAEKHFQDQF